MDTFNLDPNNLPLLNELDDILSNDTNKRIRYLYRKSSRSSSGKRRVEFLPMKKLSKSKSSSPVTIDLTNDNSVAESSKPQKPSKQEASIPQIKLTDVVGIRQTLIKIGCFLFRFVRQNDQRQGILLHGPGGCGKTMVARAIAGQLGLPLLELAASDLLESSSEAKSRKLIDSLKKSPSVVLFDQIGLPLLHSEPSQRMKIVSCLRKMIDEIHRSTKDVLVIATCVSLDEIDESLRAHGRLQAAFKLSIPSEGDRCQLLAKFCSGLERDEDLDLRYVASLTPGYTGGELKVLVNDTTSHLEDLQYLGCDCDLTEDPDKLEEHFLKILSRLEDPSASDEATPLPLRTEHFEHCVQQFRTCRQAKRFGEIPRVKWSDVGALQDVKEELLLNFLAPIRYRNRINMAGSGGDGILLVGPPGCGKTMLAKALANEAGLNFFGVSGPELINKYVGESERAIRDLFFEARSRAPSVIFFDEIDGICPSRHGVEDGAHSSRFVSQMLTELNGLTDRSQVYILAATNRPDRVDPAIRRHGRIGITIYVGIPSPEDRHTILRAITKDGTAPAMDVDFAKLSHDQRLDNFTGADLQALVDKAVRVALKEVIANDPDGKSQIHISDFHFEAALQEGIKPSLSSKMMNLYSRKMTDL